MNWREDGGVSLDRLAMVLSNEEYKELSKILYSYKDELIILSGEKKKRVEEILSKWRNDVIFIEALSQKNKHNGYQDVYIYITYTCEDDNEKTKDNQKNGMS